jgi:hypothetical protein
MTQDTPRELFEKGFINEEQFGKIEAITSGKIVSVFYELKSLLYLGVMLFTGGAGILIYKNIGELGHVVSIIALSILTIICFWYVMAHAKAYSHESVKPSTPYYDYITLLGCFLTDNLGYITLLTAGLFFFVAYRFDHLGILSLAITALASFWSITVSPQKWYSGDFFSGSHLYNTAIIFGFILSVIAIGLDKKAIKKHFTFTYLNFCMLIFFVGAIVGLFSGGWWGIYVLIIYAGCAFAYYMARWEKSFLFLLYAFVAGYLATTFLLAKTALAESIEIWSLYSIASCGGFIYFIIKYRNHFKQND